MQSMKKKKRCVEGDREVADVASGQSLRCPRSTLPESSWTEAPFRVPSSRRGPWGNHDGLEISV